MGMSDQPHARRILVVSGDTLPLPGLPTTGAGLRAWGLIKGLESRGHEVSYLMPEASLKRAPAEVDADAYRAVAFNHFDAQEFARRVRDLAPDVIVFQHWMIAADLYPQRQVPVVIDFHGPLMLETLYQDHSRYDELRQLKIRTLSKADFFTCAGERQRQYFYPWLLLSGFDVRENVIEVIPVSLSPELPTHVSAKGEVTFVYGGVFLPWQDPSVALETLVQTLEERGAGRLKLFGGPHSYVKLPPGKYRDLIPRLQSSRHVDMPGMVPRDVLVGTYLRAHVAIDVMARNPERELAFTTRTVEYLWCGLPVIYNNYAELADYICEYDAGWIVDPLDARAIRTVIESILDDPAMVARKSANAQRLVRERLTWDRTIEPLDAFCRAPRQRPMTSFAPFVQTARQQETLELFAQRVRADVRRTRRLWALRGMAAAKELGKRLLGREYVVEVSGRLAKVRGPLLARQPAGQAFQSGADYLSGIDLLIGTYERINTCDVVLHLRESREAKRDLATVTINAATMRDCAFCSFTFRPIANSAGRQFYFEVESPDALSGDCVTLFVDVRDQSVVFVPQYS